MAWEGRAQCHVPTLSHPNVMHAGVQKTSLLWRMSSRQDDTRSWRRGRGRTPLGGGGVGAGRRLPRLGGIAGRRRRIARRF